MLSFATLLLLSCVPQDAPPRSGIKGLGGVAALSEVRFVEANTVPEVLEVIYVFPDRARWSISLPGTGSQPRQISRRFGSRAWVLEANSSKSSELLGTDRDVLILQTELRRAVLLWPDGIPWTDSGADTRKAAVLRSPASPESPIGELIAEIGPEGRPRVVRALRADGRPQEFLSIEAWIEGDGRSWPKRMTLHQDDRIVWDETLVSVETRLNYGDLFFLPPEERGAGAVQIVGKDAFVSTDLLGFTYKAYLLESGSSWEDWTALALSRIEEERSRFEPQGIEVDLVPTFELSAEGTPIQCWVRLKDRMPHPPQGWTTLKDRPGLALVLQDPADLDRRKIQLLERAAPEGTRGTTPYARRVGKSLQVYLPLEPEPSAQR